MLKALKTTLQENLAMIRDSVFFLKKHMDEVFYDAEHFFDGYKANPDYAIQTLLAAEAAGADCLVLCDTNGGTLPHEVEQIIDEVKVRIKAPFGIHAHNDAEVAVANSLVAIRMGGVQVHGTINGYGERCGNANLCSIIPTLKLKMGIDCISDAGLRGLREYLAVCGRTGESAAPQAPALYRRQRFCPQGRRSCRCGSQEPAYV